ncbi:MAG: PilZ domain-containing protein [Elusimicrobia bacterium]|nr:PilZ domain-containing protein [Elusimicrobiota bacterium]
MAIPEKRRAARGRHDSVLELRGEDGRLLASVARLRDVSSSGARFVSTADFKRGARVRGRLRLFGTGALDVEGLIVWRRDLSNATAYGLRFETVRRAR